jgi:hypothetical protein
MDHYQEKSTSPGPGISPSLAARAWLTIVTARGNHPAAGPARAAGPEKGATGLWATSRPAGLG